MSVAGPTAAVLLLVRDPAEAERALPRILPGRSLRLIRREEVRHLTPLRLVARLRSLRAVLSLWPLWSMRSRGAVLRRRGCRPLIHRGRTR